MSEEKKTTAPSKQEHTAVKKVENPQKLGFGKRMAKWFREMKSELKKVVWPTKAQTLNNTGVALVMMAISAVVIWGFDKVATSAVQALITLVG